MLEAVVEYRTLEGTEPGGSADFVLPAGVPAEAAEALADAVRGMEIVPGDLGLIPLAVSCPARGAAAEMPHEVADVRIVPAGTAGPARGMQALCLAETFGEFAAAAMLARKGGSRRGRGWTPPSAAEVQECAGEAVRMRTERRAARA